MTRAGGVGVAVASGILVGQDPETNARAYDAAFGSRKNG
jgi:hypothetical protein